MYNLRKKGGVSVSTVMECKQPNSSFDSCLKEFLSKENFIRIKVPADGNCFYHTLTKFLQLSQNPSLPSTAHLDLRNKVVSAMEDNLEEIAPYLVINNNFNSSNNDSSIRTAKLLEQLDTLRRNGEWNSDTADLVSQYASKALNMRIKIYNVSAPVPAKKIYVKMNSNGKKIYKNIPAQPRKIISYTFEPDSNVGVTVNMLRIADGHYELLYPASAGVMPPRRRRTAKTIKNTRNPNTLNNITINSLSKNMSKLKLFNSKNKMTRRKTLY
jgi:hypothetical protein